MSEQTQNIQVQGRTDIRLTGGSDVARFEESVAVFQTSLGDLTIEGEALRIVRLSLETGEVDLAGRLSGLYYGETEPQATGFFRRLFAR